MPLWRNNTWNNAVLSSLFLFLSSKPSRKHLDTTLLTTYISTRAAYICIIFAREKKSIGATEISAAGAVWWIHCSEQGQGTLGINRGEMSVPPPSPAAPAASTLHPRGHPRAGTKKSHYKPLHGEKQRTSVGLLLCLWDKSSHQFAFIYSDKNIWISTTQIKGHRWLLWTERKGQRHRLQLQSPLRISRMLYLCWVEGAVIYLPCS